MIKAELVNKKGYTIATIRQTEAWTHSFGGFVTLPCSSWNEFCEEEFLLTCCIKWDGCSHFVYSGQDYLVDDEDSYYHECGLNSYYTHFVAKLFAFEVAKHHMKDVEQMDDDLYNTIDKINILDSYSIKYSEIDAEVDTVYQRYLEKAKESQL